MNYSPIRIGKLYTIYIDINIINSILFNNKFIWTNKYKDFDLHRLNKQEIDI